MSRHWNMCKRWYYTENNNWSIPACTRALLFHSNQAVRQNPPARNSQNTPNRRFMILIFGWWPLWVYKTQISFYELSTKITIILLLFKKTTKPNLTNKLPANNWWNAVCKRKLFGSIFPLCFNTRCSSESGRGHDNYLSNCSCQLWTLQIRLRAHKLSHIRTFLELHRLASLQTSTVKPFRWTFSATQVKLHTHTRMHKPALTWRMRP